MRDAQLSLEKKEMTLKNRSFLGRSAMFACALSAVCGANAQTLWDNGPFATGLNANSQQISLLESDPPLELTIYGFGNQLATGIHNRVADDFTIPSHARMEISAVKFYAYQTGSTTTSTITGVNFQVWNGVPGAGGSVVWGDDVTNRLSTSVFSNVYRVDQSNMLDTNRPIMTQTCNIAPTFFGPGTFWLDWQSVGSSSLSGPWAPPVTLPGLAGKAGANGRQNVRLPSPTWSTLLSGPDPGTAQDVPFTIIGRWELAPTAMTVFSGDPLLGDLASLRWSDDNRLYIGNDFFTPNGEVRMDSSQPGGSGNCTAMGVRVEALSSRPFLVQIVQLMNDSSAYVTVGSFTLSTTDQVLNVASVASPSNFVQAAGALKSRVRMVPTQDLTSVDGWNTGVDQFLWFVTP